MDYAIRATISVAESKKTDNEIINIGNDLEETAISDLAALICRIMSVSPRLILGKAPEGSTLRRVPSLKKLRSLTGCEPKVNLRTGLRRTIEWYNSNPSPTHNKK